MRLFLMAAIPLVLSVPVQMAIGLNKIKVIALAALAGSLVNLPISCYLTARLGVSGVIWGTVLTTLFSNLLVPGVYVFRELKIDPRTYLKRTLSAPLAGAAALVAATWGTAQHHAGCLDRRGHLDRRGIADLAFERWHSRVPGRLPFDARRPGGSYRARRKNPAQVTKSIAHSARNRHALSFPFDLHGNAILLFRERSGVAR